MALSASIVWEVRSTGVDTNGGGFKAGATGTDYSQQNTAQKSGVDLHMHATTNTKCHPNAAGVAAADVGNLIYIASGAGWTPGYYEITVQDGADWTLDRSPSAAGNADLGTYAMGGAAGTPGMVAAGLVAGNTVFCKGDQTITTATLCVSGGCVGTPGINCAFIGYATTRTSSNADTRPIFTINAGVSAVTIFNGSSTYAINLSLDGGGNTTSKGSSGHSYRCHFANFTAGASSSICIFCTATTCSTTTVFGGTINLFCQAYANTAAGFASSAYFCLASGNTGATTDGFLGGALLGCVAYGNGRHGFSGVSSNVCINCIAEANVGSGFATLTGYSTVILLSCAAYNNGTNLGAQHAQVVNVGFVTITEGSPFVDAASGNFALNATANRGSLLRNAGFPSLFPLGLTGNYPDIGVSRHQDPTGGGGLLIHPGMSGGLRG